MGGSWSASGGVLSSEGSFTHLHLHTEFSMLDGAARIKEVVKAAAADGQPAIGITDHGNMYGVLDFYAAAKDAGIKPIVGSELYMAANSRHERPTRRGRVDDGGGDGDKGEKLYYHLIALAETNEGYRNLMQISSRAYLEGYYYKPRSDFEILSEHAKGVIATSGCLGGITLQALLQGNEKLAIERASTLQDIFGRDNFFIELQDHGLAEQKRTNPMLIELARKIKAPLLATNDSHYTSREDHLAHDALLCVQTGSTLDDPNRFKFDGDEHYLKSAREMRELWKDYPEACDNSLWIAERANVDIEFGKVKLPEFPRPEGFDTASSYLRELTFTKAHRRYCPDGGQLPSEVVERLEFELGVIDNMGFSDYFLVVWDLVRFAKEEAHIRVGPGRGSAAGCCVAYCLGIVDLDPIKYDLLFERFLNPGRKQMPDIDMDFDDTRRGEMIKYAAKRYGWDCVAQIVTFGTIKARAAVRDASRVLGYPYAIGDRIAKLMPPLVMGRDTPLYACMDEHPKYADGYKMAGELRELYKTDPEAKKVVDVALGLEGLRRSDGIHAAAVVITNDPLTNYLPIQRKPGAGEDPEDAPIVTQYEMHGVEDLGLLKMDFLGLRNLSVIERALDLIQFSDEARLGIDGAAERFDIDNIPMDDDETLAMLRKGDSIGVFQLEGTQMRALMRALAPTSFEDVAALIALYRPGPMAANMHMDYADRKNGRKPIEYMHPDMAEILGDTYGLMIYQELLMRMAQKFAGYTLEQADNLRKACFPAGTKLLTKKRGYFPIERVMELRDRRVQTIDTESYNTRFEEVEDVWSVGVKAVYRMTTSTGYSIEATAQHPFLKEGAWTALEDLQPGDLVGVASRTFTDGGSKISDAEIDLSALMISEGYMPDHEAGARGTAFFCNTDPELIGTFKNAYRRRFKREHGRESEWAGVTRLNLTREELIALKPILGPLGVSGVKAIPESVVNAPLRKVERFLGLYFCADGWTDRSGIHFASKSRAICLGLKRMLLRCGLISNLHVKNVAEYGQHWTLSLADKGQAKEFIRHMGPHITLKKYKKVELYSQHWSDLRSATNIGVPSSLLTSELARRVMVTGKTSRQLGIDTSGYRNSRVLHKETLNGLLFSEKLEDVRTGDLTWDTIVSIEYVGDRECFDFRMRNEDRPYAVVEDFLAHNCGKKVRELIAKERVAFVEGCERTGYGSDLGTALFDIIEPFADYAFNKSHSYGYGFVSYQTAYLKAHYPAEYLAALLGSVKDDKDKTAVYLSECRALGIDVLVPDVNSSESDFIARHPDDNSSTIPFGLSGIRNVGEALVEKIVQERVKEGSFVDFYDFCLRVDMSVLNKRAIESLVKAGAFDSLGHPRQGLLLVFEQIVDATVARRKERDAGVMSLFGGFDDDAEVSFDDTRIPIPDTEFDKHQRLAFEKEMLGLYVSDHPLMGAEAALRKHTDCTLTEMREMKAGDLRIVGGIVTNLNRRYTKRGDLMATFILEDLQSAVECWVFPRTMQEFGSLLVNDSIVCVKGRIDDREDQIKLVAMEIKRPELVLDGGPPLRLGLSANRLTDQLVKELKQLLAEHPGDSPVYIQVDSKTLRLPDDFNVNAQNGLMGELRALLGPDCLIG